VTLPFLIEMLGWLGAGTLGVRAIPQTYKCWKQGHAKGISRSFLWLWILGQIFMLAHFVGMYLLPGTHSLSMICYSVFILCLVSIITFYRYFPREDQEGL